MLTKTRTALSGALDWFYGQFPPLALLTCWAASWLIGMQAEWITSAAAFAVAFVYERACRRAGKRLAWPFPTQGDIERWAAGQHQRLADLRAENAVLAARNAEREAELAEVIREGQYLSRVRDGLAALREHTDAGGIVDFEYLDAPLVDIDGDADYFWVTLGPALVTRASFVDADGACRHVEVPFGEDCNAGRFGPFTTDRVENYLACIDWMNEPVTVRSTRDPKTIHRSTHCELSGPDGHVIVFSLTED